MRSSLRRLCMHTGHLNSSESVVGYVPRLVSYHLFMQPRQKTWPHSVTLKRSFAAFISVKERKHMQQSLRSSSSCCLASSFDWDSSFCVFRRAQWSKEEATLCMFASWYIFEIRTRMCTTRSKTAARHARLATRTRPLCGSAFSLTSPILP